MSQISNTATNVVILGAGHAGAQVAASLRQDGFEGAITLVSDEPDVPYHKPPRLFLSHAHADA